MAITREDTNSSPVKEDNSMRKRKFGGDEEVSSFTTTLDGKSAHARTTKKNAKGDEDGNRKKQRKTAAKGVGKSNLKAFNENVRFHLHFPP